MQTRAGIKFLPASLPQIIALGIQVVCTECDGECQLNLGIKGGGAAEDGDKWERNVKMDLWRRIEG